MKRDTDIARVQVLDVQVAATSSGGALSSRSIEADWATEALAHFNQHRRKHDTPRARLEWPATATSDWTAEENPHPPAWVDVITPAEGGAVVRVRLRRPDPGEAPTRVAFEVRDDSGELTTRYLRRLGFGPFIRHVDKVLDDFAVGRMLGAVWRREVHRPGRAGRPDRFYAEWAGRYVDALKRDPHHPIGILVSDAAESGDRVTPDQLRSHLKRARSRGLLTSAPAGKAGGALTAKARRLVEPTTTPARSSRRSTP